MSTVNLTLTPSAISGYSTVEQFHQAVIASLSTATSTSNVILGQIGGSLPTSNVGPWLNVTTWYAHNGSTYVPATIKVGSATYQVTLAAATLTANRTITFPDKDGILALTSDIYGGRAAITLASTAGSCTVDWSLSGTFNLTLTEATTMVMTNPTVGQEIRITIYNPPTLSYAVTWPAAVKWVGGTAPTQTAGGAGGKTDLYILKNIAGNTYGRQLAGY